MGHQNTALKTELLLATAGLIPYSTLSYVSTRIRKQNRIKWTNYPLEASCHLEDKNSLPRNNYLKFY